MQHISPTDFDKTILVDEEEATLLEEQGVSSKPAITSPVQRPNYLREGDKHGRDRRFTKLAVILPIVLCTCIALVLLCLGLFSCQKPKEQNLIEQQRLKQVASSAAQPNTKLGYLNSEQQERVQTAQKQAQEQLESMEQEEQKRKAAFTKYLKDNPVAQAFTAESNEAFALWSKGRLAVSDPQGKELFFEVDPLKKKLSATGNLALFGSLISQKDLEAQSVTARDSIVAQAFSTPGFTVDKDGALKSLGVEAQHLESMSLKSQEAQLDLVSGRKAELQDLSTQTLRAQEIEAPKLKTQELALSSLNAESIATRQLSANSLNADKAEISSVQTKDLVGDKIVGKNLEAQDLKAERLQLGRFEIESLSSKDALIKNLVAHSLESRAIKSQTAQVQELLADKIQTMQLKAKELQLDSLKAEDVSVTSLRAQRLSGSLEALRLSETSRGMVFFQAPKQGEVSRIQFIEVPVPANTVMLALSPQYQDSDSPAQIAVSREGERFYIVARYPSYSSDCSPVEVGWFAILA